MCIVKNFKASETFNSSDLIALKSFVQDHPGLPWLKVIDSGGTLVSDLAAGANKIQKSDRARYNELIVQLKLHPDPETLLEASSLFLANNPGVSFALNSKDKILMRKFVDPLEESNDGRERISHNSYKHCRPEPEKYQAIMKDRERCSTVEDSLNSMSLYTALAEIAACERYNVEQVGVTETFRTRSLSAEAPCVVKLKDVSASIGGGTIDIKSNGTIYKVDWFAGHDLSGKKNDLKFWRDQLEPAVQKILFKNAGDSSNGLPSESVGNQK